MKRDYIWHSNSDANDFIEKYFPEKKVLFIGSIGFDPRTLITYDKLKAITSDIVPIFLQELRKGGSKKLRERAENTEQSLKDKLGFEPTIIKFPIFASDGAPIGGLELIKAIQNIDNVGEYTDIIIDICAMSRGIFFPLVRYFREHIKQNATETSLHIMVIDEPAVDYKYKPQYHDRGSMMKGFTSNSRQLGRGTPVKLWLPQLMSSRSEVYEVLHRFLTPDDVCPVLPFPGIRPKMVDELVIEYQGHISSWETGLQNIVLAAESDPLDLYESVFRAHEARRKIFESRQLTILSPLGSKVSTIGGLLAAMDLDLPVAYVETIGYYEEELSEDFPAEEVDKKNLVHVWVDGPIYPYQQQYGKE